MTTDVRPAASVAGEMRDASGLNFFDEDRNLQFALSVWLQPDDRDRATPLLREAGAVAGGRLDELARVAEQHPPRLVQYNARGERVDEVVYHPAYREMETIAFGQFALTAVSHRSGLHGFPGTMPHAVKYALSYVLIQSEFGLFCPVNMTDSLARVLRKFADPEVRDRFVPRLTSPDMADLMQGAQFMTEKSGGSDVGASETVAVWRDGWRLTGDKWFCSNVSADLMLTLARPEGAPTGTRGLGLFLVPKALDDGSRNAYQINRLKEKLGTRDMASGEVTLDGAFAYQVGALDRGFVNMMEMVNSSRLSNAMRAAALTRRGLLESTVHAAGRRAFGQPLDALPLMRETLLEMTLDSESALAAVLHTGSVFDRVDAGDDSAATLRRILTPLLKFAVCKRARISTGEAMEVRGGNGYIEDWINPRLLRDAHLGSIWEGTTSVIALDVLRALTRESAGDVLFADIERRLGAISDAAVVRAAATVQRLMTAMRRTVEQLSALDAADRESVMVDVATRLYLIYAASLLLWEAAVQARSDSYRKLVVAAEFIRRRLLADGTPWLGPRPGSRECFEAVQGWQPVAAGAAAGLIGVMG